MCIRDSLEYHHARYAAQNGLTRSPGATAPTRICEGCSEPFASTGHGRRFCSVSCKQRTYRAAHLEQRRTEKNKEKVRLYNQTYRAAHRDEIREKARQYRKVNPERFRGYMRAYYWANRESLLERQRPCLRAYYQANKGRRNSSGRNAPGRADKMKQYRRAWYLANKEKVREQRKEWVAKQGNPHFDRDVSRERTRRLLKEQQKGNVA